jgi:hypothetical protein
MHDGGVEFGVHQPHAENAPREPAEQSMLDPQARVLARKHRNI